MPGNFWISLQQKVNPRRGILMIVDDTLCTQMWVCNLHLFYNLSFGLIFVFSYFLPSRDMCHNHRVGTSEIQLEGKVVLITGGNAGIGKETAIDLGRRGARVYIACRNLDRGRQAVKEIIAECNNNDIHVRQLNLASFLSIQSFAKDFLAEEEHLHILINNAGIMSCPFGKTEDGLEMQMGVNHFGHFLLTNLLLERLKQCQPSRVVTVSSVAHKQTEGINFDDLNSEKSYHPDTVYAQSKLANILFTKELHRRYSGSGVSAFALHPGLIMSALWVDRMNGYSWFFRGFVRVYSKFFFKSLKEGAQTTIYCAVQPGLEKESGNYFADSKLETPKPAAFDMEAAKKLWARSEEIVGIVTQCEKVEEI